MLMLFSFSFEIEAQLPIDAWHSYTFKNAKGEIIKKESFEGLYNSTTREYIIKDQVKELVMIRNNYGYCVVTDKNHNYSIYDTNGKKLIPKNKYRTIDALPRGLFVVSRFKSHGPSIEDAIIDANERFVLPFGKYIMTTGGDFITRQKANRLLIPAMEDKYASGGKWGLIDFTGSPVTDFIYDYIIFPSDGDSRYANVLAEISYKDNKYYVDKNWDVINIVNKNTGKSLAASNQNTARTSSNRGYNSGGAASSTARNNNDSSIKAAAAIGVFIGLAAVFIDAISSYSSSKSSSSSSSYSSSSSSSSSYSSSSRSTSLCSYCSGRGMENCIWCYGSGIRKGGWFEEDETCWHCKGQGRVWCWHCNGKGSR